MFALEEEQPTEDVNGFLACYQTSQQNLNEIIALIPIPYQHIRLCAILVQLVYALGYVRRGIQTVVAGVRTYTRADCLWLTAFG